MAISKFTEIFSEDASENSLPLNRNIFFEAGRRIGFNSNHIQSVDINRLPDVVKINRVRKTLKEIFKAAISMTGASRGESTRPDKCGWYYRHFSLNCR
ncbi:hypothetical protein ACFL35_17520 [Candidatus Riflebacteria bacterium]